MRASDRRRLITAALALMVLAGSACASKANDAGSRVGATEAPRTSSGAVLPDVARIVCGENGLTVLTPAIRPQQDGLHFQIERRSSYPLDFLVSSVSAEGSVPAEFASHGDNSLPLGTKELDWLLPPGPAEVECGRPDQRVESIDRSFMGQLEIVDQDGIYVPFALSCGREDWFVYGTWIPLDYSALGGRISVFRKFVAGLRPNDVVKGAGYPGQRFPVVLVVRGGAIVAYVVHGLGTTTDDLMTCKDSGIRPKR